MKNKFIIYVLGALFVVTLLLGIIGFLNRNNTKEEPKELPPVSDNVEKISYNGEEKDINSLDQKLSNYEFVKANKEFNSGYIKVYIDNNQIKIDVQKSGIPSSGTNTPDKITYTVSDISSPVGVQAQMSKSEGNRINVYTIDTNGRLYLSSFNADPNYFTVIKSYVFDVSDISSFAALTVPLDDEKEIKYSYVVFKTNDGEYYTDYLFGEEGVHKITKIKNVNTEETAQTNQ